MVGYNELYNHHINNDNNKKVDQLYIFSQLMLLIFDKKKRNCKI